MQSAREVSPSLSSSPLERLEAVFARLRLPVAIAFSGGIDSRFLCVCAKQLGFPPLCLHVEGPHVLRGETEEARGFAEAYGLLFKTVPFDPLSVAEVAKGDRLRCYACKKAMISLMKEALAKLGEQNRQLCDGSNFDDLSAFRPGLAALKEKGVVSPLALAGCSKKEIIETSIQLGIPLPPLGSRPCLLTRFPYGRAPDRESLFILSKAEEKLGKLFGRGDFRVRLSGEGILLQTGFELEAEEKAKAGDILESVGLSPFAFLCGGRVSGFFDRNP